MARITVSVKDLANHSVQSTVDYTVSTPVTGFGHTAHPQWNGTFVGGTFPNGVSAVSNQTYMFCDFKGTVDVGTRTSTATNVKFIGCRFQGSGNVSNQGDNSEKLVLLYADDVTFDYCTFQPTTTNYPTPLTGEEIKTNRLTYVEYGKGYQYAIVGSGGWYTKVGKLLIDHSDFWGFGNAVELTGSTVAKPHVIQNSWFHHGADPFGENGSSANFHNDCWLVNDGNYHGAKCINNIMEIWGNTNLLAWQGSGAYNDSTVTGNRFSGDQQSISLSASGTSQRIVFTDNTFSTRIGRAVGTGKPLRAWAVSDSNSGSVWRRNKWMVASNAAVANYPNANWGNPTWNGKYWWPADTDTSGSSHTTDYTG